MNTRKKKSPQNAKFRNHFLSLKNQLYKDVLRKNSKINGKSPKVGLEFWHENSGLEKSNSFLGEKKNS